MLFITILSMFLLLANNIIYILPFRLKAYFLLCIIDIIILIECILQAAFLNGFVTLYLFPCKSHKYMGFILYGYIISINNLLIIFYIIYILFYFYHNKIVINCLINEVLGVFALIANLAMVSYVTFIHQYIPF